MPDSDFDQLMHKWSEAEHAASEAEAAFLAGEQAKSDPAAVSLVHQVRSLRNMANEMLAALLKRAGR
ncbi:MAG TPA: hypothetical protein VFE82_12065 [Ramlibacter sp.]|jgi:hypothetical protein|uniref:hypothetical protein n=1 Tax=Ramlibacter sp. TaxID=1917967 RepID=UPI002D4D3D27|nr:hypothetical protein [Ramlibacter sp.]HZY19207.1 hypothetical protein [Ramlibacter sp.]